MSFEGELEDRAAIRELIETYGDAVMQKDAAAWASTWDDECPEWRLVGLPQLLDVRGKEQIVSAWSDQMSRYAWVIFMSTIGSIMIEGSCARARSHTVEYLSSSDNKRFNVYGRYDDVLIKKGSQWKFRSRQFQIIGRDRISS